MTRTTRRVQTAQTRVLTCLVGAVRDAAFRLQIVTAAVIGRQTPLTCRKTANDHARRGGAAAHGALPTTQQQDTFTAILPIKFKRIGVAAHATQLQIIARKRIAARRAIHRKIPAAEVGRRRGEVEKKKCLPVRAVCDSRRRRTVQESCIAASRCSVV